LILWLFGGDVWRSMNICESIRLAVHLENTVRGFARYHKYTLGSELRNGSRWIVEWIIKANSSAQREPVLLELRDVIEQVKVTARICQEVKSRLNQDSLDYGISLILILKIIES
jgi:hypothetical protein